MNHLTYKEQLQQGEMPRWKAILIGIAIVAGAYALYMMDDVCNMIFR